MDTPKKIMDKTKLTSRKYSEAEQQLWNKILADSINITTLFRHMTEMQHKIHKLEEWYYQQYPDRLEKDLEFEKQFRELNRPPNPDASDKKL